MPAAVRSVHLQLSVFRVEHTFAGDLVDPTSCCTFKIESTCTLESPMTTPLRMASLILALFLASNLHAQLLVSPLKKPVPETQRDLLAIQNAAMEVAEKVRPATVGLMLRNAMGSGVIISEDGYILTAAHVVGRPGREVDVLLPDGTKTTAISLGLHTSADGALCKIKETGKKWPFVPFIEKRQAPKIGDWCIAMGHPGGFDEERGPPVRVGRIIDSKSTVLRTDCPITSGDSGGPLLDMQGRVIGIHSRITQSLTENYHVPATAYRDAWDRLVEGEYYPKPVPSHFLSLLDANEDGELTRSELKTDYHRRVFDRLKEEFDLDGSSFSIRELTSDSFKWRKEQARLVDIEDLQELDNIALSSTDFVRGPTMTDLFERSLDNAEKITVRIYCDARRVALGTIVDPEGFLITKASQLKEGPIECLMPDGGKVPGQLVATDYEHDLAMIRVQASGLETPHWGRAEITPGMWVAIPDVGGELSSVRVAGTGSRVTGLGVVGVAPRPIKATPAMLGISVDPRIISEGAVVADVLPRGGASEAGMERGDVVLRVEDSDVNSIEDIKSTLADYRAGDEVSVVVQRGDEEVKLTILLRSRSYILFNLDDLRMSGRLSKRRDGFVSVFQMDAAVRPELCGGPVVDAAGKVVGITIARATRVASYAIPFRDLRPVLRDLRKDAGVRLTKAEKMPEVE